MGVHCCTIVSTLTAQNHSSCQSLESIKGEQILSQFECLEAEAHPHAIKIGMMSSQEAVAMIAKKVRDLGVPVVYDPVFATSSGGIALTPEAIQIVKRELLPHISLLTPNLPEAEALLGYPLMDRESMRQGAAELLSMGCQGVLLKGGHLNQQEDATDYFTDGDRSMWITSSKLAGNYRGTGCLLSTAIACSIAQGHTLREATIQGRMMLMEAMDASFPLGQQQVLKPKAKAQQIPYIHYGDSVAPKGDFPSLGSEDIGFYPVLPSLAWLQRLLPLGVRTAQLRLKSVEFKDADEEIKEAIQLARQWQCRLFINDYWELAIKHGAYGVHLGQEDLDSANVDVIRQAGLRLGISTHSLEELGRALLLGPSYIALGPIFETTCKSMAFGPQGLSRLKEWRSLTDRPLVAIGGLKPQHAEAIKAMGVNGIALISDVTESEQPEERTRLWLDIMAKRCPSS